MSFYKNEWTKNDANFELPLIKNNEVLSKHIFIQGNADLGILSKEGFLNTTYTRMESSGLLDELKPTDQVLDLGSAEGQMEWVLKDRCKYILGIERDIKCFTVAEEFKKIFKYTNVDFLYDDILNLNTILKPDQLFERILFFNVVIWHKGVDIPGRYKTEATLNLDDYYGVLDAALEHLAPNGILYMTNQYLLFLTPLIQARYGDKYNIETYRANYKYPEKHYKSSETVIYHLKISKK